MPLYRQARRRVQATVRVIRHLRRSSHSTNHFSLWRTKESTSICHLGYAQVRSLDHTILRRGWGVEEARRRSYLSTVPSCLCSMPSFCRPNFMIFDEPTNHLDVETVDALSKAFKRFKVSFCQPQGTSCLEVHVTNHFCVGRRGPCVT